MATPVTFHSFRPLTRELAVEFAFLEDLKPYFDVDYEPREVVLLAGWWSRSKTTVVLRVTVDRYDYEGLLPPHRSRARTIASTTSCSRPPPA